MSSKTPFLLCDILCEQHHPPSTRMYLLCLSFNKEDSISLLEGKNISAQQQRLFNEYTFNSYDHPIDYKYNQKRSLIILRQPFTSGKN